MVARRSSNVDAIRSTVAKIRAGEIQDLSQVKFDEIVQVEELQIDDIEPLRAELDSFVHAVRTRTTPEVTVEHGVAAVELATRIVEAIKPEAAVDHGDSPTKGTKEPKGDECSVSPPSCSFVPFGAILSGVSRSRGLALQNRSPAPQYCPPFPTRQPDRDHLPCASCSSPTGVRSRPVCSGRPVN
jgi:hypothetical protein